MKAINTRRCALFVAATIAVTLANAYTLKAIGGGRYELKCDHGGFVETIRQDSDGYWHGGGTSDRDQSVVIKRALSRYGSNGCS